MGWTCFSLRLEADQQRMKELERDKEREKEREQQQQQDRAAKSSDNLPIRDRSPVRRIESTSSGNLYTVNIQM